MILLERFLFLFARGFVVHGSYSYPSTPARDNLIYPILVEEERGRAQSKASNKDGLGFRLDDGQHPRSKGEVSRAKLSLGFGSFLLPSNSLFNSSTLKFQH